MTRALEVRPLWRDRPFRVGLHLKSLRANMDPMRILPTLVDTVAGLDDAVLQVNCHRDILDADGARRDAELSAWLRGEAAAGRLELEVHDYFSDDDLWAYLASLDLSVLPYTFGTHSGWLEACRDLQTTVLAPSLRLLRRAGADPGLHQRRRHLRRRLAARRRRARPHRAPAVGRHHRRAHRAAARGGPGPRGALRGAVQVTAGTTARAVADLPGGQQPLPDRRALHRRPGVDDLAPGP